METRTVEPATQAPPPAPPSAIEDYVSEHVEPRRSEFNTWDNILTPRHMLLRVAKKRHKIEAQKVGGTHLLFRRGTLIGGVDNDLTTLVSRQAMRACESLHITKQFLKASGVPQPHGRVFHASELNTAQKYFHKLGGAVTVKPVATTADPAVTFGVDSEEKFSAAWQRATRAMGQLPLLEQQVDLELAVPGLHVRVCVVGEEAVGALMRLPLYVVGDGHSDLRTLLKAERERRSECEYLAQRFPRIGKLLDGPLGASPDEVPTRGAVRLITESPDAGYGGEITVDVFDQLDGQLATLAVDAMWAFPGLEATTVDIRTPTLNSAQGAAVTRVNPAADFTEFIYPTLGKVRRVGVNILDQMVNSA